MKDAAVYCLVLLGRLAGGLEGAGAEPAVGRQVGRAGGAGRAQASE